MLELTAIRFNKIRNKHQFQHCYLSMITFCVLGFENQFHPLILTKSQMMHFSTEQSFIAAEILTQIQTNENNIDGERERERERTEIERQRIFVA